MTEDAYGLLYKGRRLLEEGHAHQAAVVLERALDLEPEKLSIREELARALYNSGRSSEARQHFQQVVDSDPANDFGHYGLGLCLLRAGDRKVAAGHLKLALALRPESELYQSAVARLAS